MSKLLEQIKADQLAARKSGDKVKSNLLTTLIGEASPSGHGVTDDKAVLAVIAKFVKNIKFSISKAKSNCNLDRELEILEAYMPEKLAGADLEKFIEKTIEQVHATSMRDMGKIMGKLKNAPYTIDMGKAQGLIKKLLA